MEQIYSHGTLKIGVDQNTYLWGYRNQSGTLEGFDIDMLDRVAAAIFGPDYQAHILPVVVPNDDRTQAVQNGEVDILAETMTINCTRKQSVDFSSEYYDAHQEVLLPIDSPIHTEDGLANKTVCANSGADSLDNLAAKPFGPTLKLWSVPNEPDCLVMLQQHQVDAISTDDTILQGLAAQDPQGVKFLKGANGLPLQLTDEPYGMAINKKHQDFVQFVNAVLAQEESPGGTWKSDLNNDVESKIGGTTPDPPTPCYYGNSCP